MLSNECNGQMSLFEIHPDCDPDAVVEAFDDALGVDDEEANLAAALDHAFAVLTGEMDREWSGDCHYCRKVKTFRPDIFGCCEQCYQQYWREI